MSSLIVSERIELGGHTKAKTARIGNLPLVEDVNELGVVVRQDEGQRSEIVGIAVKGPLLLDHPIELVLDAQITSVGEVIDPPSLREVLLCQTILLHESVGTTPILLYFRVLEDLG